MTDNERAEKLANQLFERWTGELVSRNKGWNFVEDNFVSLFEALSDAEIPFEIAENIKKEAIPRHMPSNGMIKKTYQESPQRKFKTEREYGDNWKQGIEGKANSAFYLFYKIEGDEGPKEKKYGNMSAAEYHRLQQRADSFPVLDLAKLREEIKKARNS
jgi:hypothetical protein